MTTACSRALQITEIVRMICEEADSQYSPLRLKPLLALARTSRIFSEPALDGIWRVQRSLIPLVKCMSDTLWEERLDGATKTVHLRRPITSTDITRLLFYSVRVQTLDMKSTSYFAKERAVDAEFLQALDMCLGSHILMPRLSYFTWSAEETGMPSLIHRFLGPQIQKLELELDDSHPALSLIPYLKSSCPLVSVIEVDGITNNAATAHLLSDTICAWRNIRELSIPILDEAGFIHVANLAGLAKLNLYSLQDEPLYLPDFLSGRSFPVLEAFCIRCKTARFCSGVIRVISSRQFGILSIFPTTSWTASAWSELHTAISESLDHEKLHSIAVGQVGEPSRPADLAPYILSSDTLRPLLVFANLSIIDFEMYPGIDMDDAFLAEIAVAWPELVSLKFGTEIEITRTPLATLNCLIPFAQHCPDLNTLGLRMNVSNVPDFSQVAGERIVHSLEALYVGTSPINPSKVNEVAAFLSNLFPTLEYLFPYEETAAGRLATHAKNWNRVFAVLPLFCLVRSQEETFWKQQLAGGEDLESSLEDEDEGESDGQSGTLGDAEEVS